MRKYRPLDEWPLQTEVAAGLLQQLEDGRVPHALLFAGQVAVTRAFTEFLAKALLCSGEVAPCTECPSCIQFQAGSHPDYIRVAPEESASVKTAQIENLQSRITRRSHTGGRTVYVIEGLDVLSPVAANRLLKTLEEPVSDTVALLTAENDSRVLSTIQSRSFLYRLGAGKVSWDDPVPQALTDPEQPENLSFAGLLQPVIQWTEALLQGDEPPLRLAARLIRETETADLANVLYLLSVWFRDLVHVQLGETEFIVCSDRTSELYKQSGMVDALRLLRALTVIMDAKRRIPSHVGAQLNVEQMCIRIREVFRSV